MLLAHRMISTPTAECRTAFREPLQCIVIAVMSVMSGTFPHTYGVFYMTVNCQCIWGPSYHRHGERHRRNALPKRLIRYRDGHDAHDADIRAYFRQGALLYFVGSYPVNLTRRTRRAEQGAPYLCGFPTYDCCRVFSDWLITRRRHPTTGYPCRRVCTELRRVLVGNLTARNPLLAPNTVAIVGFVGFMEEGSRQRGAECITPRRRSSSATVLCPSRRWQEGPIPPHLVLSWVLSLRNPDEPDDV
jgi:hypothetical protein